MYTLAIAILPAVMPALGAVAQSQSYKTGYGRVQSPPPAATRDAPSSGLSLGTGTLLVTGALAAAVGIGLALAGTGGSDDDNSAGADSGASIVGTSTK